MTEKTILVAEDNAEWRSLITLWLETDGYKVELATDAKSVVPTAEKTAPDGFVLDFELGDGTAVELIAPLRTRFARKPIVVLTTLAGKMLELPKESMPDQFVVKNENPFELLAVLGELVR